VSDRPPAPASALVNDHRLLVEAVRACGPIAMHYFGNDVESWEKRPGHPVSEADLEINRVLHATLGGARPDYGWLSEESEDNRERLEAESVWIVDPIDGTRAFLDGRREFSISVALTVDGRPVSGVVYNPATDELFDAVAGGGTRLNGEPVTTSDARGLDGAKLLMSRSELRRADWPRDFGECAMTPISSVAYKLALVAAGHFDATATMWPKSEWDIVAGDLLVCEAGGRISDATGKPFAYNAASPRRLSVVAAAQGVYGPLIDRLGAHVSQPG
jgi:myo-inositol-1(or 4)-monophosphatase